MKGKQMNVNKIVKLKKQLARDVEQMHNSIATGPKEGLNGVQIRAGENTREIFLACSKWVPDQDRLCHLVVGSARNDAVKAEGAQTAFPVLLKVRKPVPVAANQ